MSIFIVILSLGVSVRGILYYIASFKSITSKFSKLSITNNMVLSNNKKLYINKTENAQEYADRNKIAGKAYIALGLAFSFIYLVITILFPSLLSNHYIISIFAIMITDYCINILVAIKLKIMEWDKNNLNKSKPENKND